MLVLRCWPVVMLLSLGCGSESAWNTTGAGGQGGSTGSAGSSSGPDCWSTSLDAWDLEPFDMSTLVGSDPRDPMLSGDGLRLFYSAMHDAGFSRIYETSRASRELPFEGGTLVAEWLGQNPLAHPWRLDRELFMAEDNGMGVFHVVVSSFDGSTWGLPAPPGAQINEGRSSGDPTLSADGLRIVFTHQVGEGAVTQLSEGARSQAAPGTPFSTFSPIVIPGIGAENMVVCPALSPDGLTLLFSTVDLSSGSVALVWMTERKTRDHPWEAPVHITAFDVPSEHTCVHALTADGCEVWLERFTVDAPGAIYTVAKRSANR